MNDLERFIDNVIDVLEPINRLLFSLLPIGAFLAVVFIVIAGAYLEITGGREKDKEKNDRFRI